MSKNQSSRFFNPASVVDPAEELAAYKDHQGYYRFHIEVFENPDGKLSAFVQEFPQKFMHFDTKVLASAGDIRSFVKDLLADNFPDGSSVDMIPAGYDDSDSINDTQDDEDMLGIPGCLVHAVRVRPELKNKIVRDPGLRLQQKLEQKNKNKPKPGIVALKPRASLSKLR